MGFLYLLRKKQRRWEVLSKINKYVGHVGWKKSQERIRNITLILGTLEYLKEIKMCCQFHRLDQSYVELT